MTPRLAAVLTAFAVVASATASFAERPEGRPTPTRAALMSGQYAPRTGVSTVGRIERFDWSRRPLRSSGT